MDKKLYNHLKHLKAFNQQRKAWLVLSTFVTGTIIAVTADWNNIEARLLWALALLGTIITVTWWYWTMRIIRQLIEHREEESEILHDVVVSIREIKEEVKKLPK